MSLIKQQISMYWIRANLLLQEREKMSESRREVPDLIRSEEIIFSNKMSKKDLMMRNNNNYLP